MHASLQQSLVLQVCERIGPVTREVLDLFTGPAFEACQIYLCPLLPSILHIALYHGHIHLC